MRTGFIEIYQFKTVTNKNVIEINHNWINFYNFKIRWINGSQIFQSLEPLDLVIFIVVFVDIYN